MSSGLRKPPSHVPAEVAVRAAVPGVLCPALLRAGYSPVSLVEVHTGPNPLHYGRLRCFSDPPIFPETDYALPLVCGAGETIRLDSFAVPLFPDVWRKRAPERTTVRLALAAKNGVEAQLELLVTIAPYDWWHGVQLGPESVAAFIRPEDPAVKRILARADVAAATNAIRESGEDALQTVRALAEAVRAMMLRITTPVDGAFFSGQAVMPHESAASCGEASPLELATLLCACMEGAGLRPLLAFTREAVLVGCRLDAGIFPEARTHDGAFFYDQVESGAITLLDPIVLLSFTPEAFEMACTAGTYAFEESLRNGTFACAVDIARARLWGVAPLPADPAEFDASASADAPQPGTVALPLHARDKLEAWPRRLLDLSLRNNMLNFRPGKRYVPLLTDAPGKLEDRLADGVMLRMDSIFSHLAEDAAKRVAKDADPEMALLREAAPLLANKRLRRVFAPLRPGELEKRMVQLYRSSRLALEEGGANTLFAAFGFLRWRPQDSDEFCDAPLLLVPVRLVRERASGAFSLEQADDGPRFNLTLLELLRKDYGIASLDSLASDIPLDMHGADVDGVFASVADAVRQKSGWRVAPDVDMPPIR